MSGANHHYDIVLAVDCRWSSGGGDHSDSGAKTMTVTQHRRRGLGMAPNPDPVTGTCPSGFIAMPPATPVMAGSSSTGSSSSTSYVNWSCIPSTSCPIGETPQVYLDPASSSPACVPIPGFKPFTPVPITAVPYGGATSAPVMQPATSTATTSYVPWIIGAAVVVLMIVLLARR